VNTTEVGFDDTPFVWSFVTATAQSVQMRVGQTLEHLTNTVNQKAKTQLAVFPLPESPLAESYAADWHCE
jgi:hypothetical protein